MSHAHVLVDGIYWVDLLYPSADLKHATGFFIEEKAEGSPSPSGPLRASIALACPRDMQASWLLPGKSFRVYSHAGGLIWGGLTTEPSREDGGITLHAEGRGARLKYWQAVYDADASAGVDEQPTFIPNTAVDYAVSLGAPFSRNGVDLGDQPLVADNDGPLIDMLTLLTRAAIAQGKRLYVDSRGDITYRDNPSTSTWTMPPQSDQFGTADSQYLSTLRGFFLDKDRFAFIIEMTGNPTGGTWSVTTDGIHYATGIGYNTSGASLETKLRSLAGVFGNTIVSVLSTGVRWLATTDGPAPLAADISALTGGTSPGVSIRPTVGRGIVKWEDTAAAAKFGTKQGSIDLTGMGPIAESEAQDYIDGRGALVGGRMGWTNQAQLDGNNLLYINGVWGSARHVIASQMLTIPGIIDARSTPTIRGSIQWVLQEVEITEGPFPKATVTPLGFIPRDYTSLLDPPEKPAEKEAA